MRLHSLTIFRGLFGGALFVSRLAALLHAQPSDAEACADPCCAFAAALYERGGEPQHLFIESRTGGREPVCPPGGVRCADSRLNLRNACNTSFAFCRSFPRIEWCRPARRAERSQLLPRWGTQTLDFAARYEENIRTLPLHGYGVCTPNTMYLPYTAGPSFPSDTRTLSGWTNFPAMNVSAGK